MYRMNRTIVPLLAALFAFCGCVVFAPRQAAPEETPAVSADKTPSGELLSDEDADKPASFWMQRKLKLSKDLLGGLANGDTEKIAASAKMMRRLNRIEAFTRGTMPGYRSQLAIFQESLDEIIVQAEHDNVEGAALGFTQLTISCVNCHKQLRASK